MSSLPPPSATPPQRHQSLANHLLSTNASLLMSKVLATPLCFPQLFSYSLKQKFLEFFSYAETPNLSLSLDLAKAFPLQSPQNHSKANLLFNILLVWIFPGIFRIFSHSLFKVSLFVTLIIYSLVLILTSPLQFANPASAYGFLPFVLLLASLFRVSLLSYARKHHSRFLFKYSNRLEQIRSLTTPSSSDVESVKSLPSIVPLDSKVTNCEGQISAYRYSLCPIALSKLTLGSQDGLLQGDIIVSNPNCHRTPIGSDTENFNLRIFLREFLSSIHEFPSSFASLSDSQGSALNDISLFLCTPL